MSIDSRAILITGANSGFGHRAALRFARDGHAVFATMRDLSRGAELADLARAEALPITISRLDVTSPADESPSMEIFEGVVRKRLGWPTTRSP
jgi:NAD(P)-dependent dehydrogenase (short-subunit alcohol dehydrogenase family)